jgi:hypothetical protein
MLPFGVTILAIVPQRSDIPESFTNYPVQLCVSHRLMGNKDSQSYHMIFTVNSDKGGYPIVG